MYKNKTIETRVKAILSKGGYNAEVVEKGTDILVDCAETILKKEISNVNEFVTKTFGIVKGSLDIDEYLAIKKDYIVPKKREWKQTTIDQRFDRAYKRLCKKYGKGE